MTKVEEIKRNMKLLQISYEEAEQLYNDDHSNEVRPEVKELEKKAQGMKRRYEGDTTKRKPSTKTKKVDETKVELIRLIETALKDSHKVENLITTNTERELSFELNGESYSVTLVKHRKAK